MTRFAHKFCGFKGVERSAWRIAEFKLVCPGISAVAESENELLSHRLYSIEVTDGGAELVFIDQWQGRADFPYDDFALSYQVLSQDWDNVAQVDVPLVHENRYRRFAIDISEVGQGVYRLGLVMYHKSTRENVDWVDNPGQRPDMLALAEIVFGG